MEGYTSSVSSVAIHGDIVAAGSSNGIVKIWNIQSGRLLYVLIGHIGKKAPVAISGNKVVIGLGNQIKIWSLSFDLEGSPDDNPFIWIIQKATIPHLDLINRAYETNVTGEEFVTKFPSEDAKVMLSFPPHVRNFLVERLSLNLKK